VGLTAAQAEYCQASVYSTKDTDQNGTQTASGIPLNDRVASIAHNTLPLRSRATITNLKNGRARTFLVTDRGPHVAGRCVDLSHAAAILLGCDGLCPVRVK
jgi:rare lipoprotein A